ncbi:hypothetical protein K501DRAFT_239118 [Backusella circina FSU 941]|nr:hypothetical protein K501DRAFT_239118 [Backusella circina FSU 941]
MMESFLKGHAFKVENGKFVASQDISSGTTILVQRPLAQVPLPSKRHQRCNYCLGKAQLQCCSRCRSAYFCSNECFQNAWLHFHRILCEPQTTDIYKSVDANRWLLERTALTLHSHKRLNIQHLQSLLPHMPFSIECLESHAPPIPHSPKNENPSHAVATFLEPFDCDITEEELSVLWSRIQMSWFLIVEAEHHFEQFAVGVYPITSLYIGHSCRPNAAAIYIKGVQHIIALEDISPREPITISYVDLTATKRERWIELRKRFGPDYECDCIRCSGKLQAIDGVLEKGEKELGLSKKDAVELISKHIKSWSVLEMVKEAEIREKDNWSSIELLAPPEFTHFVGRLATPDIFHSTTNQKGAVHYKINVAKDRAALLDCIPDVMTMLLSVPKVPSFTTACIKAAEEVLLERIAQNNWVEASRCSLYLFVAYRLLYPPLHPKLAHHTLVLARAGWNSMIQMELIGGDKKLERIYAIGTRTWLDLAKDTVEVVFGKESAFWRDVVELEWVYDREQQAKSSN